MKNILYILTFFIATVAIAQTSNSLELETPECQNPWQTLAGEAFLTMDDQCWQHF